MAHWYPRYITHRLGLCAGRLLAALLALGCLLVEAVTCQTFSPRKVLGHYRQSVWLEAHGLPQNSVEAVLRTRDGYLWLGTQGGAARFDGVRFTAFDHGNTSGFKGSVIRELLEDRAGNLWRGADTGGLNLYRAGRFSFLSTQDGLLNDQVRSLMEDRAGTIWVGTYGGLARFEGGRFTTYTTRDGLPDVLIEALAEDSAGGLWVGTRGGLARLKDGRFTVYTTRDGLPDNVVRLLCWDREGQFWVSTETGLRRFKDGRLTGEGLPAGLAHSVIQVIYQDREGNLWVAAAGRRLFRRRGAQWTQYLSPEGLSGQNINVIYQDPEGTLWIGTESGLSQLRDGLFQVYSAQDGLSGDHATAVYEDSAGSLWVSTGRDLNRIEGGKITVYTARAGLPGKTIFSISEDQAGNLWLGAAGALSKFKDGRFTNWTTKDGLTSDRVASVLPDRQGNLWIGTYGAGLNLFRDGRFTAYTTRDGLASDYVKTLFEDAAGNLWVGTKDGGISRLRDGRITTWINQDGRATNFIAAFYEDRSGALWIGTIDDGLSRFKDGKFAQITVRDGLYDNMVFQILSDTDDDSGNLWMSCNRGVFRVSLKELNDFADGRSKAVTFFAYGVADGMFSRECNAASPGGWRTRDGRLWFAATKGLVAIDPRRLNSQPPLLAIERVTVARTPVATDQVVQLSPGQGDLEIQYTGLSWSRPQQIRFKYKLAGLDQDWVEAGTRRTAYFPHLPPGAYTFTVIADNGDGVWNNAGRSLRIVVLPPFYRTWWFTALAALAALSLGTLIYQVRIRQLTRAQAAQEAFARQLLNSQEQERKRIAAELHDGLGQTLIVIKNLAMMLLYAPPDEATTRQQAQEISAETARAISEVKEISYNLRPFHLDQFGLTRSIESLIDNVAKACDVKFSADLEHIDGLFAQDEEINLYRIVQESLNNIVKHAGATAASVVIRRGAQDLLLTIKDNGCGFSIADCGLQNADYKTWKLASQSNPQSAIRNPQSGGFGLSGLSERARLLGGEAQIQSEPGQGTTVSVKINVSVHRGSSSLS